MRFLVLFSLREFISSFVAFSQLFFCSGFSISFISFQLSGSLIVSYFTVYGNLSGGMRLFDRSDLRGSNIYCLVTVASLVVGVRSFSISLVLFISERTFSFDVISF